MSVSLIFPYTVPPNYTPSDPNKIEVDGVFVKLKPIDNPSQTFNQPFTSFSGFTFDGSKTGFDNLDYPNSTFACNYNSSIDANWGDGTLTGTPVGGAGISGNKLDLSFGDIRYVTYDGIGNASKARQKGAIRFKCIPNYSGTPSTDMVMISISKALGSDVNRLTISHEPDDSLRVGLYRDTGSGYEAFAGEWTPSQGEEYEFELNYDFDLNIVRLFVEGIKLGFDITPPTPILRSTEVNSIAVGTRTGSENSNFKIDDILIFSEVQHTANYSPGYTVNDFFTSSKVQQEDQAPLDSTCWATYTTNINLNASVYGGVLTGTPFGGAAVSGNRLDLAHNDLRYVDYSATNNADFQQVGAVKFKLTPNYTSAPSNNQIFVDITKASGDSTNRIAIFHEAGSGSLKFTIKDSSDVSITVADLGTWSPTALTIYEFELNVDINTGANRLFIDGTQKGSTDTNTGTRDSNIGLFRVGSNLDANQNSNFYMEDLVIFDAIQHTANYTPSYTLTEVRYLGDLITLPQFSYTDVGSLQAFIAFATIQNGAVRANLNGMYWTGSEWATSDDSYAQMNSPADINTNIGSLPASDTLDVKMRTQDINTQMDVDDLTVTYTGQIYPTDNPYIESNSTWRMEGLIDFIETATILGDDQITYLFKKDANWVYWTGSEWDISDESYSQTNTAAEILANKDTFTTYGVESAFRAYLHSDDGNTTPLLDQTEITYDYSGEAPDAINTCTVWGYQKNIDGSIDTRPIFVQPDQNLIEYKTNTQLVFNRKEITPNDVTGYWEIDLTITEDGNMDVTTQYLFEIGFAKITKTIPDVQRINFNDL